MERETLAADGVQLDFVSDGSSFLFCLLLSLRKKAFVSKTQAN